MRRVHICAWGHACFAKTAAETLETVLNHKLSRAVGLSTVAAESGCSSKTELWKRSGFRSRSRPTLIALLPGILYEIQFRAELYLSMLSYAAAFLYTLSKLLYLTIQYRYRSQRFANAKVTSSVRGVRFLSPPPLFVSTPGAKEVESTFNKEVGFQIEIQGCHSLKLVLSTSTVVAAFSLVIQLCQVSEVAALRKTLL